MPQNIISRNLGKVKIDEIYTHQNADISKGPDGLNIRGNMYVDNTIGIGTEYTYDSSIRVLGNMQLQGTDTNQLFNIKNNLNNTLLNIKNNKIGINTDNPIKELDIIGNINIQNGTTTVGGNIIPLSNELYDLGSAQYKFRHLFLSENSIWIGDEHKITIKNGQMKIRKRKNNIIPESIVALGGNESNLKTFLGLDPSINLNTIKLNHWNDYMIHLSGDANKTIDDIFRLDNLVDWEEETNIDSWLEQNNNIYYSGSGNIGIGISNPTHKLDILGNLNVVGNSILNNIFIDTINEKTSDNGVNIESVSFKDSDITTTGILSIDTINEKTSDNGVTIDSVVLKDGGVTLTNSLLVDTINEKTSANGVSIDSVVLKDGGVTLTNSLLVDTISEKTSANGVSIDSVVLKDGGVTLTNSLLVDTISESTSASGVTIDSVLLKDNNITAHTISAQNYSVGGTNFISASRQGNFRDLEVKDNANNSTILLSGGTNGVSGGDISITGILSTDTINEKTSGSGVTIDSVLLKDNNITAHTISAQNYSVGGTNFISASRQGNFRDLEVKDNANNSTILLSGGTSGVSGGDISITGTLSSDTISEKTSGTGVTIDSVLLKDNNVTAHTISAQNYSVGGTNFISASRQGNFRDLEVKDNANNSTILLSGGTSGVSGGDISITGTLSTDTISEKTSGSGVTIDSVLLKDGDISVSNATITGTASVSSTLSAATGSTIGTLTLADGSITDSNGAISFGDENLSTTGTLASGNATITGTASVSSTLSAATGSTIGTLTLADGSITDSNGAISFGDENLSTTGSLSIDTINEKTSNNGVNIESISLKDGSISTTGNIITNGSLIVDTINEKTSDNGVNIDSVLIKDGNITTSGILSIDTINEKTSDNGINIDSVLIKNGNITTSGILSIDNINEKTSATGVTIDSVLIKDGNITTSGSLLIDNINEKTSDNGINIESVSLKDGNISTTGTFASGNATITGTASISSTLSAATDSTIGTLTLADGSITDSNGAISFGDENLSTTGTLASGNATITGTALVSSTLSAATGSTIGTLTLADGAITDSNGAISFDNENLSTTGTFASGNATITGTASVSSTLSAATGSTIGTLTLADGTITDSNGAISFDDENLSTTGTLASGNATITGTASISSTLSAATGSTIGTLTLADGTITDSNGAISFDDENLSTTGTLASGNATITGTASISSTLSAATGSTIGTLTLADGSITDSNGAISFGDENLSTTGILLIDTINEKTSASGVTIENVLLKDGNITTTGGLTIENNCLFKSNVTINNTLHCNKNLVIAGNLTVNGNSTRIDSNIVSVKDSMFKYAKDNSANSIDFGFYGQYVTNSTTKYAGLYYKSSDDKIHAFKSTETEPTTIVDTSASGYSKSDIVCGGVDITSLSINSDSGNNGQILSTTGSGLSWINNYSLTTASDSVLGGIKVGTNLSINGSGVLSSTDTTYGITDGELSQNNFTDTLKSKLDGIEASSNNYSLPTASDSVLGGIKVGTNLSINGSGILSSTDTTYSITDGELSQNNFTNALKSKLDGIEASSNNYSLPTASDSVLGGIKVGTNLSINGSGILSSTDTTYSITDGELSQNNFTDTLKSKLDGIEASSNNYSLPTSSSSILGGVKVGTNLSINGSGVLSSTDTTYSVGDGELSQNNFTNSLKSKLDGIEASSNNYSLSTASSSVLGGIKVGTNLSIDGSGVLSSTDTTYSVGDGELSQNNFTDTLKSKLDGIEASSNNYSLPTASDSVLGGIKVGTNLSIDGSGVLTATDTTYSVGDGGLTQNNFTDTLKSKIDGIEASSNNYSLPTASDSVLGGIKVGTNLSINGSGVLSSSDTTYSITDGELSKNNFTDTLKTKLDGIATSANNYSLPTASDSVLGGIKVGTNLSINGSSVLSSTDTTYSVGDGGLTQNNFTDTLKSKLDGIEASSNNYSLPTASDSVLGGIKVGTNLSINNGVLSSTDTTYSITDGELSKNNFTDTLKSKLDGIEASSNNYSLPTASDSVLGGIKVGTNLSINNSVLSSTDTTYSVGDGGLTQNNFTDTLKTKLDGIEASSNNYSLPTASDSVLGGIKVGTNLSINGSSVLSSTDTTYSVGDGGLTQNNFTDTLKTKLDGIEASSNNYSLPTASDSVLGGIKVGGNLNISSGVLTATNTTYSITDGELSKNNFTDTLKTKLDGIEASSNNYSLPTASDSVLGGIKVGTNLSINGSGVLTATNTTYSITDGELSQNNFTDTLKTKLDGIEASSNNYSLPTASDSVLGGIKVGTNLSINGSGVLTATNTTYSITDGELSQNNFTDTLKSKLDGIEASSNNYSLPTASDSVLGGIKVGTNLSINGSGVLTATNTTYSITDGELSQNNFTDTLKSKLDGIEASSNNYSLPTASDSVLGGIKVGTNLSINGSGVLSSTDTTYFTTSGDLLYPTDTTLQLLVGSTANPNNFKLRVNGDAYINGPTYIEQSTNFGIRLIRSGFNGISWYASEADAYGNTNRKAYIQADTGSNGKMYFNCLSQQFIFGENGTVGRVGINRESPDFPLDVDHQLNDTSSSASYRYITTLSGGSNVNIYNTSAKFDGRIWITDVIYNSSDRRIKENINELNSSQSLEIIDKLKVSEYTLKDIVRNGSDKHLGFIAQEVEEIFPLAVNDGNEYIPDIYKNVDCVYTKVGEEYKVKISELGEVAGVKYRFYVWVGEENKNENQLELVGNEDNTFTFEKEYENVFCYGKKVSNFKTLEKETLYDLNVSATQELHNEIKTLKTEVETLKTLMNTLINSTSFKSFTDSVK